MGLQTCREGHEIRLPHYGLPPGCPDCADLIKEYSGFNREEENDDSGSEDDIPGLDDEVDAEEDESQD